MWGEATRVAARLILRRGGADSDGRFVGWDYITRTVEIDVPSNEYDQPGSGWQVVGAEYLEVSDGAATTD